jgi:hypothetical protein
MHKLLLVGLSLSAFATMALAQGKVDTKWHCTKAATEHKLDVGDAPDHAFAIAQGKCEATASEGAIKEKSGQYTEFRDMWKASFKFNGNYNATADNGDMIHYTYDGTASTDITKPVANKWKIVSATGKYKGAKGSGSCAGKMDADGNVDWRCTGTVTMGMAKMEKMSK